MLDCRIHLELQNCRISGLRLALKKILLVLFLGHQTSTVGYIFDIRIGSVVLFQFSDFFYFYLSWWMKEKSLFPDPHGNKLLKMSVLLNCCRKWKENKIRVFSVKFPTYFCSELLETFGHGILYKASASAKFC